MKRTLACLALMALTVSARPFKVLSLNNQSETTTDTLRSGDFIIGVNDFGGGAISMVQIPGLGNIMGPEALAYGRMGQSSIRENARHGKYNPTQAGFTDRLGTECEVAKTPGRLTVLPRGLALWRGDSHYDFTRWENIGPDGYGNAGDEDGLVEENLSVTIGGRVYTKQEAEVHSEFDYFGTYEDVKGRNGIKIPAFRHYFEYRFIRPPGHCLNQFRAGTPIWNQSGLETDLSKVNPPGVFPGTDKDMNGMTASWSIRNDSALWNPPYRHIQTNSGAWLVTSRNSSRSEDDRNYKPLFIIADSAHPNSGKALGFYRPNSLINTRSVVGVRESDGSIQYWDDRIEEAFWNDVPERTPTMSWMGFRSRSLGLINRTRLPAGVYETFRQEFYIFTGTPNQIKAAMAALEENPNLSVPTRKERHGVIAPPHDRRSLLFLDRNRARALQPASGAPLGLGIRNLVGKQVTPQGVAAYILPIPSREFHVSKGKQEQTK